MTKEKNTPILLVNNEALQEAIVQRAAQELVSRFYSEFKEETMKAARELAAKEARGPLTEKVKETVLDILQTECFAWKDLPKMNLREFIHYWLNGSQRAFPAGNTSAPRIFDRAEAILDSESRRILEEEIKPQLKPIKEAFKRKLETLAVDFLR